jgi:hypothetical protein
MGYKTNVFFSFQQMFLEHLQRLFFYKKILVWWSWGGVEPPVHQNSILEFFIA